MLLQKEADNRLTAFERIGMENYLHEAHIREREHIDTKVKGTQERFVVVQSSSLIRKVSTKVKHPFFFRIEHVIEDLEQIKENLSPKEPQPSDQQIQPQMSMTPIQKEIVDHRFKKLETNFSTFLYYVVVTFSVTI